MLLHHAQTKIKQPLCVCTRELSDGWARVDSNKHRLRQPMRELTESPVFKPFFRIQFLRTFQYAPDFSLLSGLQNGLFFIARRILRQCL